MIHKGLYEVEDWRPVRIEGIANPFLGKLIAFEGIDGAGKTTMLQKSLDWMNGTGRPAQIVRVPTEYLRSYVPWKAWYDDSLGIAREDIDGYGLSIAALGDRLVAQKLHIVPLLQQGINVLCDRYTLTSIAHEATEPQIYILNRLLRPDVTIFLDVDVQTSLNRIAMRDYEKIHDYDLEEKTRLISNYRKIAQLNDYTVVNSDSFTESETFERVITEIGRAFDK